MVESFEGEIWKDAGIVDGVDLSGFYIVSNFGRIFMFERTRKCKNGMEVHMDEKLLPEHDNGTGYKYVSMFGNGRSRKFYVHRVVATVHVPNPDPEHKTDVNHLDENKANNRADNLEWSTPMENNNYGTHVQRISDSQSKTPTLQLDMDGNIVRRWKSAREAHKYGWNYKAISAVLTGSYCSDVYKGYIWMKESKYEELGRENVIKYCKSIKDEYRIVQLDKDDNVIKIWDSKNDIPTDEFTIRFVFDCARGAFKTYKGFKWMKYKDYIKTV